MFDEGPHVSYAACPTPYFVADRIQGTEKIIARTPEEFEKAGVHVHVNTGIVDLDMKAGTAKDSTGRKWPFDVAVYATGASSKIPKLRGIVPICASCKKIGDDQGYWHQVEVYVRDHSEMGLILEANLTAATLLGVTGARWSSSRLPGSSSRKTRTSTTSYYPLLPAPQTAL